MPDGSGQVGYLGVTRSLSGRLWRERPADADLVRRHQLGLGVSEPLARAMASRGVLAEQGETYLNPTLKALFPDPSSFTDMDRAAEILVNALERKRPLVVFADYDVDGASSAAQLVRWFRAMGQDLPIYVPDRILEGYGPSPAAFRRLKDDGAELVITVDCGAAAHDALACAAEIGLEVVVIDHHLMRGEEIPRVAALVKWRVQRKLTYWYQRLERLEAGIGKRVTADGPTALEQSRELAAITDGVSAFKVPRAYAEQYFNLRGHIELVRSRLGNRPAGA